MRRWLLIVYLFLVAAAVRADAIRGAWHMTQSVEGLHLNLTYDDNQFGRSMDPADFRGLTADMINASRETPANFQLARDAGTFEFHGTFLDGDGVGRFTFTPDPSYADRLRAMGVSTSDITDKRLFSLASLDVSTAFIRDMQALGYRVSLDRYVAFRIHGATPQFVRDLAAAGYANVSADKLVAFRIHGVSPEFIRDLKGAGYDGLSQDQLVAFRIHGVSAAFAGEMRRLGVRDLAADDLVALRIHGATVDFVRDLGQLGYHDLTSSQLVSMRIHGVSADFIRELADAGYHDIPVEKLVQMRIHGVTAEFVHQLK